MSKTDKTGKEKLRLLLAQELEIFEEIYEQCLAQSGLMSEDKAVELESSLDKTEKLREKINGLHQETKKLMQSYLSASSEEKDPAIDELIQKTKDITEKSAKLNKKNMVAAKAVTEEVKQKIDEQRAKRKGIGGYTPAVTSNPEHFDKKT